MKILPTVAVAFVTALLAAPAVAQTEIGGGVCNSSTLNGTYAFSLAGRQVNSSGTFLNVSQSIGTATFDGQSSVSFTVAEDGISTVGAPVNSQGSYSVEANCTAAITVSNTASFNVAIFNAGKNFLITGTDGTYAYSGSGTLPFPRNATCSTATLNGMYSFNSNGFTISNGNVSGIADLAGLLQFDGQGTLTVNGTTAAAGTLTPNGTLTGTYTIASNCTGTATLSDSNSNSLVMAFSIYTANAMNQNFYASLARLGHFLVIGGGHNVAPQPSSFTCSASTLNGTYSLSLNGRAVSPAGNFAGSYQGIGIASFDGNGNLTLTGTANSNVARNSPFSYSGSYTLGSNCSGTFSAAINGSASFALVVWAAGSQFALVGSDSTYVYSMSGSANNAPPACATATISGKYTYTTNGFTESGTTQNGVEDEAGVMQFDGQGNITSANYTQTQSGATPVSGMASGTYAVGSHCSGSATLQDSSGHSISLNFQITGPHGESLELLEANSAFIRGGSAHSTFGNPSQAIGNVASYAYSATPPGSVFVLFGQNLTRNGLAAQAAATPLPTKLLDTTVTVNGVPAPLFYANANQIDAQMPWDIPGNAVASVIVTNGTSTSNIAAVYVSATGTPGISTYGTNHAVVVNADQKVNSGADEAKVGDEVVVYFTGGGPVNSQVNLITGDPAGNGLSPLMGDSTIFVGGVQANVDYIGLTPGSIGLYQANFNVPQLAKGVYPVIITIDGFASNNPVMNVN